MGSPPPLGFVDFWHDVYSDSGLAEAVLLTPAILIVWIDIRVWEWRSEDDAEVPEWMFTEPQRDDE